MSTTQSVSKSPQFTQPKWVNKENLGTALITLITFAAVAAIGLCVAGYLGVSPFSHLPLSGLISISIGSGIVALTSMLPLYILKGKGQEDLKPANEGDLKPLDNTVSYAQHSTAKEKMDKQTYMAKKEGLERKKTLDVPFLYNFKLAITNTISFMGTSVSIDQKVSGPSSGAAETQGQRSNMEDAHCVKEFTLNDGTHVRFAGVFDGHGDDGVVAKMLSQKFPQYLEQYLNPLNETERNPEKLGNLFTQICFQLEKEALALSTEGGSTGVCSLVMDGKIYTINVGDSRAVQIKKNQAIQLSEDASPGNPRFSVPFKKYKEGNITAGNMCSTLGINYSLALTRHFGIEFTQWKPKITCSEYVSGEDYLVVACDGLWDVCNATEAHQAVSDLTNQGKTPPEIAATLVCGALKTGSEDNISVVVLKL